MKLHPPRVIIDPDEPFKNALFERKDLAQSLTSLLRNVTEGLVVFVNAPWGEGKTTFAQMWQAHLKIQKLDVIYFDAYAADYFDDPFVSFSGEILELADKKLKTGKGIAARRTEFKKTAIEVGKRLAGLTVKVGLKAATMGAVDATHIAELKEIGGDVASGVSEIGADIIEKKIEGYSAEKDALKVFKQSLSKLASVIREEQGFPLTIIVDELDRCRPDFALKLLERIKHLFDVEGVAFVLLVNRDQIESYVRTVYGERVDASAYLLKFANVFVDLPSQPSMFRHGKGREEYCRMLFQHYAFDDAVKDGGFLSRSLNTLVSHFRPTLREIEKTFTVMALYYSSLPPGQLTNEFLVAMLSILKIKRPDFYYQLSQGNIDADTFWSETKLDRINKEPGEGVSQEWVSDMINFCLMSEADMGVLTKDVSGPRRGPARMFNMLVSYNLNRQKLIPLLCSGMDRFTAKP